MTGVIVPHIECALLIMSV